jgi:hypothetical protein
MLLLLQSLRWTLPINLEDGATIAFQDRIFAAGGMVGLRFRNRDVLRPAQGTLVGIRISHWMIVDHTGQQARKKLWITALERKLRL